MEVSHTASGQKGSRAPEKEQEAQNNRKGILRLWPTSKGKRREESGRIMPF